jgi:outer membrane immunogenic protein
VLRVECTRCDRKGRYSVAKLIEKHGRKGNLMVWREMLNADCPRRDARIHDRFTQPVGSLSVTASEKLKWFGTIRGRVGLAADRALLYVTGGAAFAKTQYSLFAVEPEEGGNVTLNGDTSRSGYTVGGGIEVAFFGGWTAKAEYQYLNFGSIGPLNATAVDRFGVPLDTIVTTNAFHNDYHTFRFGLNYRFDWGKAPVAVMAKY